MTVQLPIGLAAASAATREPWRVHLGALAGLVLFILAVFHRDAADMVEKWLNSSTYNHCLLIVPIVAWLVAQRLPELSRLQPAAWPAALLLVMAGGAAWLLGEAGGVALGRHVGLVLMLQGTVIALLGKAVARGLAFPIFYCLFLIPTGEEILPLMQSITAQICMALLAAAGVPAHLEGIFITIPNGYFKVAEACAGVKFLVAMIALGALVANLCFTSWKRRALFMLAAILIPILANGLRAWGTIYIAHLTDSDFAVGFDHVVYGWFFFALVIALVMAAGWRFFDRKPNDPWFDPICLLSPAGSTRGLAVTAGFCAALAILPSLWSGAVAASGETKGAVSLVLPEIAGWRPVPADRGRPWQPHFAGADALRTGRYRDSAGREVDLAIAFFSRQEEGREIVGFGQGAVGPDSEWSWIETSAPPPNGRADRIASYGVVREVVTFYRVGESVTGSDGKVKLETIKARLLGGPQRAVAILISAQAPAEGVDPRPAIDAFLEDLGPIARLADEAAVVD